MKEKFRILYGFIMLVVLGSACVGVVTAADVSSPDFSKIVAADETGDWEEDNKFVIWGDGYSTDFILDSGASTVHVKHFFLGDSPNLRNVDTFKQSAQEYIDSRLNTIIAGYKITSVEVLGTYGSELLTLSQMSRKDAVFERFETGGSSSTETDGPGPCSCTRDLYDCYHFPTQADAQACYDHCEWVGGPDYPKRDILNPAKRDIHNLDPENDGVACKLKIKDDVCKCTSDLYDCDNFPTQIEAQACYDLCKWVGGPDYPKKDTLNPAKRDIHNLDPENDGIACRDAKSKDLSKVCFNC
jgi:hypothetical protein